MNALNPLQPSAPPGQDPRAAEPSMEEILASIRRIIADDQSLPAHTRGPNATLEDVPPGEAGLDVAAAPSPADVTSAPAPASADASVRPVPAALLPIGRGPIAAHTTLPDEAGASSSKATELAGLGSTAEGEGAAPGNLELAMPHPADAAPRADGRPTQQPAAEEEGVVSNPDLEIDSASDSLFSEATDHSVTAAFNVLAASRIADQSDELLQLVRGMIRPLLKAWIDENVPGMVERMIRAEIERITRVAR